MRFYAHGKPVAITGLKSTKTFCGEKVHEKNVEGISLEIDTRQADMSDKEPLVR